MDVFEALFTRRSIRKFTDEPVSDADLQLVLKAAMCAPSAHNKQPWHFVVVRDTALLSAIAERHPYAKMAAEAPVVVVVCANPEESKSPGYWQQDCSAALENMLIAARGRRSPYRGPGKRCTRSRVAVVGVEYGIAFGRFHRGRRQLRTRDQQRSARTSGPRRGAAGQARRCHAAAGCTGA